MNLQEINAEIQKIETLLANEDYHAAGDDEIQAEKYRAGAEAITEFDPDMAIKWQGKASELDQFREKMGTAKASAASKTQATLDKDQKKQSRDDIKQLAVQYRNARMAKSKDVYANLSETEKRNVETELSGIKARLMQDDFGKYLVGAVDNDVDVGLDATPEPVSGPAKLNLKELRTQYSKMVADSKNVDATILDLEGDIDDLAEIHGDTKVKSLRDHIDRLKAQKVEKYTRSEKRRIEGKGEFKDLKKRAYNQKPIYSALAEFRKSPADVSTRSNALNLVLRKESGAAIGSNEYASKLQTWLGDDEFESYISDMGGWKGYLAIKAGAGEQMALSKLAEYLGKVNPSKIETSLQSYLEDDVMDYYQDTKGSQAGATAKSKVIIKGWK